MKIILHLVNMEDGLLALRAAKHMRRVEAKPGDIRILEYEDGRLFEARRNKHSISVWRIAGRQP